MWKTGKELRIDRPAVVLAELDKHSRPRPGHKGTATNRVLDGSAVGADDGSVNHEAKAFTRADGRSEIPTNPILVFGKKQKSKEQRVCSRCLVRAEPRDPLIAPRERERGVSAHEIAYLGHCVTEIATAIPGLN